MHTTGCYTWSGNGWWLGALKGRRLKGSGMSVDACIPVIPSADLEKSVRFWVDGLGFSISSEMRKNGKLTFCMLRKEDLWSYAEPARWDSAQA